jgi:hypothetical protein
MKRRAAQRVQELQTTMTHAITQPFDAATSVADLSVELDVARIEPGLALRVKLGVASLVEPWQLPQVYVAIINAQLAGDGIQDSPPELYCPMTKVPLKRRVVIPTQAREKGSALLSDLRRVMEVYGMEEALNEEPVGGKAVTHRARRERGRARAPARRLRLCARGRRLRRRSPACSAWRTR